MAYDLIATSVDDAKPVELYHFHYSGNDWYMTSSAEILTRASINYTPTTISSSDRKPTLDPTKSNITITAAANNPVGELFRIVPPSEPVIVTIYEGNLDDTDWVVAWKGRVLGAEWTSGSEIKFTSESAYSSAMRQGVRRPVQPNCPFVLYGPQCGVARSLFEEESITLGLTGITVTVQAAAGKIDNYYAGGMITWVNNPNGNIEKRFIRESDGTTGGLVLNARPVGLTAGMDVKIYAGCSHALEDENGCVQKFDNSGRYGGTPYMPTKNPFNGSTIY
jgi:hypothetical protein